MSPSCDIVLKIDQSEVAWSNIYVHLRDPSAGSSSTYLAVVPHQYVQQVFDPHFSKPRGIDWETYIAELIVEFGTFVVSAFIENMAKLCGVECDGTYEWVISTVDQVRERNGSITLSGRADAFDPTRF